ncbi:MAG: TIGR01777 family oxidoreductase [Anaerolineales bacterium]|nr:TIGR01777 family oxidoreductase [Anaerolineales bacterium]
MKITIAGGSGFIGTALSSLLVQNNHQVIILSRRGSRDYQASSTLKPNPFYLYWDGANIGDWVAAIHESDAVINLAGENIGGKNILEVITKRWTPQFKEALRKSRISSGKALSEAIEQSPTKPQVFIQASAVGYYGSHPHREMDEDTAPGDDFLAKLCVEWENSTAELDQMGIRRVITRIAGVVMALNGGSLPFILLPYRFFLGGPLGNGKQWVSWIHLQDLIRAMVFLLETPQAKGPFNLCAPQPVTSQELSKVIGRVMRKPSFFPTPEIFFRSIFGEKADLLLSSQKQVPKKLLELGFEYQYPTAESALMNLLS